MDTKGDISTKETYKERAREKTRRSKLPGETTDTADQCATFKCVSVHIWYFSDAEMKRTWTKVKEGEREMSEGDTQGCF